MNDDNHIKKQIDSLRTLYTDVLIDVFVSILCIIIWICMGFGPFWPIWVVIAFTLSISIKTMHAGLLPRILAFVPFLKPEWGEETIHRLLNHQDQSHAETAEIKKQSSLKSSTDQDSKTPLITEK